MMFEPKEEYRKPIFGIILLILAVGLIVYIWGAVTKPVILDPPSVDYAVPYQATLNGEYTCLPHKNSSEPHTLECALGLKADNGSYYALDVQGKFDNSYYMDVPTGTRIQVTGEVVPIEAISSDQWRKYDIKGIMHVTGFTKI